MASTMLMHCTCDLRRLGALSAEHKGDDGLWGALRLLESCRCSQGVDRKQQLHV